MLSRFQDLNTKILPLMEDYLIALRSRDNTPASLLRMDKDHEEEMINNYTSDMKSRIQGTLALKSFYHGAIFSKKLIIFWTVSSMKTR